MNVPAAPQERLITAPFAFFLISRVCTALANQMVAVALGWYLYDRTRSAYDLGYLGLCQFLPVVVLTLVVGHVADRFNRQLILLICNLSLGLLLAAAAIAAMTNHLTVHGIFAVGALLGAIAAFQRPTLSAILPAVVPLSTLSRAIAVSSSGMQTATIIGPSFGGLLYAGGVKMPLGISAGLFLLATLCTVFMKVKQEVRSSEPVTLKSVFSGIAFVKSREVILGVISLDLFAVLLGGVTALLPIFARTILHAGPWALGLLRSAPAVGALLISVPLSRRSLGGHVGLKMFFAVIVFGVATIVFSASTNLWLSLGALLVLGAADNISVVIRTSMVQLATPDAMRGRVNAVNSLFIGTSNQLGEFESGITAGWFGPVAAGIVGGVGTILVALLWMRLFPRLRRVSSFSDVEPEVAEPRDETLAQN